MKAEIQNSTRLMEKKSEKLRKGKKFDELKNEIDNTSVQGNQTENHPSNEE